MNRNVKLIWRLYPYYLLITLVSLFAVGWYTITSLRNFFLDRTEAGLVNQCILFEKQITQYLEPLDGASIDAGCKNIAEKIGTRITVIMADGKVVGDSQKDPAEMDNHRDRPEFIMALSSRNGTSIRHSATLNQRMMYVAVPVLCDNKLKAVLRASLPITSIDNQIRSIQTKIALFGVLVAFFSSIVCLYVSKRIAIQIKELEQGAVKFAQGDLGHRLLPFRTFEFARLSKAMNQMAAQLDDRIKTIISQKNEYEAVLSSMVEGVIAIDNDECVLSINQAAAKMLEIDSSAARGRSIREVIRKRNLHKFLADTISGGKPKSSDIIFHNGAELIVHTQSVPLSDHNGQQIGTLLVFNDVTQIRRLENMRRDFAANVSHELKTPLTAIKGFVETLQNGAIDKACDSKRFLSIIENHVDRVSLIIDDLLNLSKIEQMNQRDETSFTKIRIKDVIETAVFLCREKADEKDIKIEIECAEDVMASIDPYLIEQAFLNLLDNAVKYSDTNTSIRVKAAESKNELIVSFIDQGVGIEKKHLSRLFERFYRVDKSRSRAIGGTGLGLAIVKHIVKLHGGNVTVDSEPGEGSIFNVHLPKLVS